MGSYTNPIVQSEPTSSELSLPATVDKFDAPRITPKIRSGYFYAQDRRHYLYARKGACYLSDITWHVFDLADQPIPTSERVWVRGVEITGTTQYFFQGTKLWVSGGAFTHPGVRWGVVEQDHGLTPYESRDMLVPGDEVKVDYDYYDYSAGTLSAAAGNFVNGADPGIDVVPDRTGTWADTWTITIPAATGSAAAATVDLATKTITLSDWDAASTTVQDAIDAFNAVVSSFTFSHDGVGSASGLLNTTVTALGGAPINETFSGGVDGGNTSTNLVEIQKVIDGDTVYRFERAPKDGAPVVMTDDRMYHWDGRDIAPEFIVTEDGFVEFNVPENLVANPDFEGDTLTPIEWATTGTVEVYNAPDFGAAGLYPRSGSRYVRLASTATIVQSLRAFGTDEQFLSMAIAGSDDPDVTMQFYDNTWTLLGTDSFTPSVGTDWTIVNRSYGPAGRQRTYDYNPPADAVYVVLTITSNHDQTYIDYAFWGKTPLEPDHWIPHRNITVEFETDLDDSYYEHHPDIAYSPLGEAIDNLYPQEPTNLSAADNYEVTGFLYWKEDCEVDFRGGLGGTADIPTSAADGAPLDVITGASATGRANTPDGEGGFFCAGDDDEVRHVNKYGIEDWTLSANDDIDALFYDVDAKILYIGGAFTSIDSTSRNRLASYDWKLRQLTDWDPDSDTDVNYISDGASDAVVIALAGTGATVGGSSRDAFAEISKSTGLATSWAPGSITGGAGYQIIYDDWDENYIGCGSFTTAGSDYLRMWNNAGTLSGAFDPAADDEVHSIDYNKYTGVLFAGGQFANIYATAQANAAKIDLPGDALVSAWAPTVGGTVTSIVTDGTLVFLGGFFGLVNGATRPILASVDHTTGVETDFYPLPSAEVRDMSLVDDVLFVSGAHTTLAAGSYTYHSAFPVYSGSEHKGRRHVPYAKVDGLGKLAHEGILRYNAQPWTREVTWCQEEPEIGEIALDTTQFVMLDNGNNFVTQPSAGDTELDLTVSANDDHVGQVANQSYALISESGKREVIKFKSFSSTGNELESAVENTYTSASIDVLYPLFKIYVDQDKYLRGKILDLNGAPMAGVTVEARALTSNYSFSEDQDITNQDGEFRFLVNGLVATPFGPDFLEIKANGLTEKISIIIEALP